MQGLRWLPHVSSTAALIVASTGLLLLTGYLFVSHANQLVPTDAEITAFARDVKVEVGEVSLVLPLVAIDDGISMAASYPSSALVQDRITVSVETYGWDDVHPYAWKKICDQLSRKWSRSVCDDPWSPLQQALPNLTFYLADDRHFEAFSDTLIAGGRTSVADLLQQMRLEPATAKVICDRQVSSALKSCIAAVLIEKHLVAVWWVTDTGAEGAARQAECEGRAISAFAKLALGPSERFDALLDVVCMTRRPGSGPSGITTMPPYPCTE